MQITNNSNFIHKADFSLNPEKEIFNNSTNSPSSLAKQSLSEAKNTDKNFVEKIDDKILGYISNLAYGDSSESGQKKVKEFLADAKDVGNILSLLANKDVQKSEFGIKILQKVIEKSTLDFSGTYDAPETINSKVVIGLKATENGEAGFLLEDESVVSQSEVLQANNAKLLLQSAKVLTSDLSEREKGVYLASIGVDALKSNELLSSSVGEGLSSITQVLVTAENWSDLSEKDRALAVTQNGINIANSLDDLGYSKIGASQAGKLLSGVGAAYGIYTGVEQSVEVFDSLGNMTRSDAKEYGAKGLGAAGASIGAGVSVASAMATGATIGSTVPVVGTIVGAAVGAAVGFVAGAFGGSKKSKERMQRDAYRDVFVSVGLTQLNERKMDMITLADGNEYHIGEESFIEKQIYNPALADPKLIKDRAGENNRLIAYEVDYTSDLDYMSSLAADALSNFILIGAEKRVGDMTAYLTNAAVSNAESREFNLENWKTSLSNMRAFYERVGITDPNQGMQAIQALYEQGQIDTFKANQFVQGLQMIFSDDESSFELAKTLIAHRWPDAEQEY